MGTEEKANNKTRNLLMIAGVVFAVVICVIMACLGVGTEDNSKKEVVVRDFNATLPSAKVEEVTDDKFEAIKREQHRLEKEQNELEGSSFGLLNGETEQSQGVEVNTEMAELADKLKRQEDEQQQKLEAEKEALEAQRKKLESARGNVASVSTSRGGGNRSFNLEEQRKKNQDVAYKKLQDQYGKELYPDRDVKPAEKKETPQKVEIAKTQNEVNQKKTNGFNSIGSKKGSIGHDIRAVVHGTHKNLTSNSQVKLRLLDPMVINGITIPKNSFIYGKVGFSGGRVQISIDNVNYDDNVLPFKGEIFDQDGGKGIYVPDNAISDAAQQAEGNTISGTQTRVSTQRSGSLVQSGINAANSGINAMKNAVQKKASENKVSISANYKVTIREKR